MIYAIGFTYRDKRGKNTALMRTMPAGEYDDLLKNIIAEGQYPLTVITEQEGELATVLVGIEQ